MENTDPPHPPHPPHRQQQQNPLKTELDYPGSMSLFSDDIPSTLAGTGGGGGLFDLPLFDQKGFMDLLGFQDHYDYVSPFDLLGHLHPPLAPAWPIEAPLSAKQQLAASPAPAESSEVVNNPATPNSSVSCSSNDRNRPGSNCQAAEDDDEDRDGERHGGGEEDDDQEEEDKTKKLLRPKKKEQKRQRQPRFAFMTKSEVDHLDDGYRWRKYGQKAVKNSPHPRSYYRCTTAKCGVKKRVERSMDDPSIVVTTYEGQHTHLSPMMPRGSIGISPESAAGGYLRSALAPPPPIQNPNFQPNYLYSPSFTPAFPGLYQESRFGISAASMITDHVLLPDIVPSPLPKELKEE